MSLAPSSALADDPDYHAFCGERLQDPYPLLHRLRAEDPVHWCEPMKLWFVTRYDDANTGLRDPRLSSNRMAMYIQALPPDLRARIQPLLDHLSKWIQFMDNPDHDRLRKLVNQAFTPKSLHVMRSKIENVADQLLRTIPRGVPFDLIETFCAPFPATVICEMIGVPAADQTRFRRATERVTKFSTRGGPALQAAADDAHTALRELIDLFQDLVAERRRAPQDDLLSVLVSAQADGQKLSDEELYAMCVFLFFAGHDTTTHGVASGLLALMRHPDQWEKLKSNVDAHVEGAVEEALRYESPVPRGVRRARENIQLRGREIPAGAMVIFLLSAANRDPEQFPEPDQFDIARSPNKHLAFSYGIHFCLGAVLARIEMEIAFRAMVRHCPRLKLTGETLTWRPVMGIRGLERLPVIA